MKIIQHIESENFSTAFLYLTFMFIHIDYVGILDYLIKAMLGAGIWFSFKFFQDYFTEKMRYKMQQQSKEQKNKTDEKP